VLDFSSWPLWINIVVFLITAGSIALAGTKLAEFGDRLADHTGLGEVLTGIIFLGFTTALPGLATSITAALDGRPTLAISNAIGGIAIQTTFLAVADIAYVKANLEHAAASVANMIQTAILITLLTLVFLGLTGPEVTLFHVHPMTPLLFLAAGFGFLLVQRSGLEPMWQPRRMTETVEDIPEVAAHRESLGKLLAGFIVAAVVVTIAGFIVARTIGVIADETGLSVTVAGALFAGVATSLPELVTTVAAVRRGALTLAVSDIVGGNFFNILFVFDADLVYLNGSLYHAKGVGEPEEFLTGLAILLNIILLLGLLYRQCRGPANIGFESILILLMYLAGFLTLAFLM
jgi:cation:H+ antiporter